MELRNYQEKALRLISNSYRMGNKAIILQSATGSGKGVMLTEVIRRAVEKGSSVLFLVHRRELLFQTGQYLDDYGIEHGVILSGEEFTGGHKVNIATIQTIHSRLKRREFDQADIIIIDEAHGSVTKTYETVIKKLRDNLVIGFTATPCRKTGKGLGSLYDDLICVETIKNLTDQGFLVPVRYFAPTEPDLTKVRMTAGEYNIYDLDAVMTKPRLVGDVVANWLSLAEDRQTIVFTTTVAHSVAVCEAFNDVGITAEHLDGKTPKDKRAEIIWRFRNGYTKIICNCAVLTEGVDIPDISCVVMARPTKSLSLYLQCVGRGMRPAEEKKDMLFIDHAGACLEHGPVDEITEWTLDEKGTNSNKKNDERKERASKPITCPMCSRVYTGQLKCPQCGHVPEVEQFGKEAEFIDADLGEVCFKKKTVKKREKVRDPKDWYNQLHAYAEMKEYKSGWVAHKYKEIFGCFPRRTPEPVLKIEPEVLNFIRSQNIRYAKRRRK
jgi:superfamily II DNA or RNA helicase